MRYKFICHSCKHSDTISFEISNRDKVVSCPKCSQEMLRMYSAPSVTSIRGCVEASKRDGVGCLVDQDGKVYPPKVRGSEKDRRDKAITRTNNQVIKPPNA